MFETGDIDVSLNKDCYLLLGYCFLVNITAIDAVQADQQVPNMKEADLSPSHRDRLDRFLFCLMTVREEKGYRLDVSY
jgi:hypothetical protein